MEKPKAKPLIIITLLAVSALAFIFYLQFRAKPKPNVILIMLDCLRADHLSCYGYTRNTSPNIDALAKNGVIFFNAFSQGGYTLSSVSSIFTSKFPLHHGVLIAKRGDKLSVNETTLAQILKKNGYVTAGFTGGGYTGKVYGLNQGFDLYQETDWGGIEDTNQLAFNWLEKNREKPFFLFLHSYTIHDPFAPPEPFNKLYSSGYRGQLKNIPLDTFLFEEINNGVLELSNEDMEHITSLYSRPLTERLKEGAITVNREDIAYIISQYDGGIRYCDAYLGKLFQKLKNLGLASNTIIILTADHGEDLMDHGTISHGDVYDENIHVPLIISFPRSFPKDKKIYSTVRSIDIMPTVLAALGLPFVPGIEGASVIPLISGKQVKPERPVFSLGVHSKLKYRLAMDPKKIRVALRTANWKLITSYDLKHNTLCYLEKNFPDLNQPAPAGEAEPAIFQDELYNLENDPQELNNLAAANKQQLGIMQKKLQNYIQSLETPLNNLPAQLDEKTKQRLESLGYLQ